MKIFKTLLFAVLLAVVPIYGQDASKALKVGDKAPQFTLKNALGKKVKLSTLLKNGNVVLTWYRGGWCPYCNRALQGWQEVLAEIKAQSATFVALTPELPDYSLSTKEKHQLTFEILTDLNNEVASRYGLVFTLDENTAVRYEKGFGLSAYNGNHLNQLPMPATYIINQKGVIVYAFVNADYTQRANTEEVIKKLKEIK